MKNTAKKLLVLSSTFLFGLSLVSCGGDDGLIHLDYGNIHSYKIQSLDEIAEQTYDSLTSSIKNEESFMLMIRNDTSGCGDCWANFKNVLVEFVNEYHIDIKYIGISQFTGKDKYNLYLEAGDMPSIAYFKRGELVRQATYISKNQNDRRIFTSYTTFVEHIKKNVALPRIYYLDKDVLDSYIESNMDFTIYYARSGCGDCKAVNKGFLHDWVDNSKSKEKLYMFDLQKYQDEDKEYYQELKDTYQLSSKYNPILGYSTGAVPTFQHLKGGNVNDMIVVYNDYVPKDSTTLTSYFTQERVDNMPFLKGKDGNFVLDGKILSDQEAKNWRDSTQAEYHDPILQLFLDEYIK